MDVILETPVRKKGAYVSRVVHRESTRTLRIHLQGARILRTRSHPDQGETLTVRLPEDGWAEAYLQQLDGLVLEHMLRWFRGKLPEDVIRSHQRVSVSHGGAMRVWASSLRPPVVHGHDSLAELLEAGADGVVCMEIEAQGLHIQPKRFGVRWRVCQVHHESPEEPAALSAEDRAEVEATWSQEVAECRERVTQRIAAWRHDIDRATYELQEVMDMLEAAKAAPDVGPTWNAALEMVSAKLRMM